MRYKLSNANVIFAWVFGICLAIALTYWRYGYGDVISDQFILDLKGIYEADPLALRGDWFTENIPQPHWIYDLFVGFFESYDLLSAAKIATYLLSICIFAAAMMLLGNSITGFFGTVLSLMLITLGPVSPLGSGTLILGWTLPQSWGASLAILCFAFMLRGWLVAAILAAVLTPFGHSQHGLHIGLVVLMFGIGRLNFRKNRDRRSLLADSALCGTGVFVMGLAMWVAKSGSVAGLGNAYDRACEQYAPFHCFSSWWPATWWIPILFVVPGVTAYAVWLWRRQDLRPLCFAVVSIFTGYLFAIFFEYFQISPFAHIARIANVWRWIAFFLPLAALGYSYLLFTAIQTVKRKLAAAGLVAVLPVWLMWTWMASYTAHWELMTLNEVLLFAVPVGLVAAGVYFWKPRFVPALLILAMLSGFAVTRRLQYTEDMGLEPIGKAIGQLVPSGEKLISNPGFMFIRLYSRRAIIADFKGIPYDDPYLGQWEERLADLGGFDQSGRSYYMMPYERWLQTAKKYQARYALVHTSEPRFEQVRKENSVLGQAGESGLYVFRLKYVP